MDFTSCHIIPPLKGISSRILIRSGFRRVRKQLGIFQLRLVLTLPGGLGTVLDMPSYFHDRDATSFRSLTFPVHNLHLFLHKAEVSVGVYFSKEMTRDSSDRQSVMYV